MSQRRAARSTRTAHSIGAASLAGFLGALFFAAPALAASGGHEDGGPHALDLGTLALQLLNFGVLLFLLVKFGGRALGGMLQKRHETLKADLETSEGLRAKAEARLREQDARLASLETELADLRESARKNAMAEKARLVALAEEKAQRLQSETKFLIAQEVRQAEASFRAEVASAAARIAEELVRRQVGPQDHARLLDGFVGELDQLALGADPAPGSPGGTR